MFDPQKRQIFKYSDGGKEVFGDPVVIQRTYSRELGLRTDEEYELFEQHLKSDVEELSRPAAEKALEAVMKTFNVKHLDPETGKGLTENEMFDLVRSFFEYVAEIKKN